MRVLAIDPGTVRSAWCLSAPYEPLVFGIADNPDLRFAVQQSGLPIDVVAVEMIASYGMAVGKEVFETCVWIGRFIEQFARPHTLIYRLQVKMNLCHSAKANDANIRQALIDRFGGSAAIGKKATPGPLYGVSKDVWAALAVAVTYHDDVEKMQGVPRIEVEA